MSKSWRKRRPQCRRRQDSAIFPIRSPRRSSSGLIVSPTMYPSTSASSSGSAATNGAPMPVSDAAMVLWISLARSIASRPVSLPEMRTT